VLRDLAALEAEHGLTSWAGPTPRKADVAIAKNYLDVDELDALNKIVVAYLDFAEVQALNRRPMYMVDWIAKLDEFLKLADREVLAHAGLISHAEAVQKAEREFETFAAARRALPSQVAEHFDDAVKNVKQLERGRRERRRPKAARSDERPRRRQADDARGELADLSATMSRSSFIGRCATVTCCRPEATRELVTTLAQGARTSSARERSLSAR
jgi:hypothetical protein